MNGYEKGFGNYRSNRDPVPVLPAESSACPRVEWRMCAVVVVGCAQPYRWKITSVNPNLKQFLSVGDFLGSHIRSV